LMGALEDTTTAQLDRQLQTNFVGLVSTIQSVLPLMREQHDGTIRSLWTGVFTAAATAALQTMAIARKSTNAEKVNTVRIKAPVSIALTLSPPSHRIA
ncbi:MAG: hypothetical protein AAGL17_07605, partial [Cyanobacteria bacterium J06576_12]